MNKRAEANATSSWLAMFRNWKPGQLAQSTALVTARQGIKFVYLMLVLLLRYETWEGSTNSEICCVFHFTLLSRA